MFEMFEFKDGGGGGNGIVPLITSIFRYYGHFSRATSFLHNVHVQFQELCNKCFVIIF